MVNEINSSHILSDSDLENHLKIYAGPGAGKTYFLVENVKNIITTNKKITSGCNRKVLCITYTHAAVNEICERLEGYTEYIDCYTIHGFINEHIIKPFQSDLIKLMKSDFEIEVKAKGKITSQIEGFGPLQGIDKNDIYKFIQKESKNKENLKYTKKSMESIQININNFINSNFIFNINDEKFNFGKIQFSDGMQIKKYLWSEVRKLTFDEVLYFGLRILETNSLALYTLRVKFPYIFIDEFQDTNPIQTKIIKKIGEKSTVIGVIGDIAQSIYSFQGAKPSELKQFNMNNDEKTYKISDNRRSNMSIVNFCNFLRQSDSDLQQKSNSNYIDDSDDTPKVHFLIGMAENVNTIINNQLQEDCTVLTNTWARAFKYIQDITDDQSDILKKIYNNYYASSIQIREDIISHKQVTWVKATSFILRLYNAYQIKSINNILEALKMYYKINENLITPKSIMQLSELLNRIFKDITEEVLMVDIINRYNKYIIDEQFNEFRLIILSDELKITLFSEYDKAKFQNLICCLEWKTADKLFNEVFSKNSKYMTVHQAKGLEWDKVLVSIVPTKKQKFQMEVVYNSPDITKETDKSEFIRLFYVACSRAREELYIHIEDTSMKNVIQNNLNQFIQNTNMNIAYEFIE